jgi:HNH endonuclease
MSIVRTTLSSKRKYKSTPEELAYAVRYRKEHGEEIRTRTRERWAKDPKFRAKCKRQWRKWYKRKASEEPKWKQMRATKWKEDNREKWLKYRREWHAANRQRRQKYVDKNRATIRAYGRKWQRTPKGRQAALRSSEARRSRKCGAPGYFSTQEWLSLCKLYDMCCAKCRKRKRLVPDHIIPLSRNGTNFISNIQPLCVTCNLKKGPRAAYYPPPHIG